MPRFVFSAQLVKPMKQGRVCVFFVCLGKACTPEACSMSGRVWCSYDISCALAEGSNSRCCLSSADLACAVLRCAVLCYGALRCVHCPQCKLTAHSALLAVNSSLWHIAETGGSFCSCYILVRGSLLLGVCAHACFVRQLLQTRPCLLAIAAASFP